MPDLKLPLGTEVSYRGMTGKDEDLLTNKKKVMSGEALDEIMANCVTRMGEKTVIQIGDVQRLKSPDRTALMLAIRMESYGVELDATVKCGNEKCGETINVTIDLSSLPQKPAPEGDPPYEVKLSSGIFVKYDYLDGNKERVLMRTKENIITQGMLSRIVEVEDVHKNDVRKWLLAAPVKLRNELRAAMAKTDCGVDTEATADCSQCGHETKFDVQGQEGFFFPQMPVSD